MGEDRRRLPEAARRTCKLPDARPRCVLPDGNWRSDKVFHASCVRFWEERLAALISQPVDNEMTQLEVWDRHEKRNNNRETHRKASSWHCTGPSAQPLLPAAVAGCARRQWPRLRPAPPFRLCLVPDPGRDAACAEKRRDLRAPFRVGGEGRPAGVTLDA